MFLREEVLMNHNLHQKYGRGTAMFLLQVIFLGCHHALVAIPVLPKYCHKCTIFLHSLI